MASSPVELRRERLSIVRRVLPVLAGRVRMTQAGGRYIVPDTLHWADWRDDDAIRCHGRYIGAMSLRRVAAVLVLEWQLARSMGEVAGGVPGYTELYDATRDSHDLTRCRGYGPGWGVGRSVRLADLV